jgi:ketosteroid isomerase-like protein
MEGNGMKKQAIESVADIERFFDAFNRRDWEMVFQFVRDDCVWEASEKRLEGRKNMLDYWTQDHVSFRETLGMPEKVVFGDRTVYLQVKIRLDFLEDGFFFGKSYRKGETIDFSCADFYELDEDGKIRAGRVFTRFNP